MAKWIVPPVIAGGDAIVVEADSKGEAHMIWEDLTSGK